MKTMVATASYSAAAAVDTGERLHVLSGLTRDLANSSEPETALYARLDEIAVCLNAEATFVLLFDETNADGLICPVAEGANGFHPQKAGLGLILRHAVTDPNCDLHRDMELMGRLSAGLGVEVESLIFSLLSDHGEPFGLVIALNAQGPAGFMEVDKDFLEAVAESIALAIRTAWGRRARDEMKTTNKEIELAAAIQQNLLPVADPLRSPVQGMNRPARKVSGDFFDYLILGDGTYPFALGDVSGKGINAALLMSKTASLFRCLAKTIDDPAELLSILNREIRETATHGMFVTMIAGVYDARTGRIRFANAGHEPPLLRLPNRQYLTFPADAPPIGILDTLSIETTDIDIGGGEFYIFSDGLTELACSDSERLGVNGLIQMVEVSAATPIGERLESVLAELQAGGWSAHDDLTALTIDGAWIHRGK